MNIAKKTLHMLGALSVVGSVSSAAWAGNCTSDDRAFVNGDSITVSCKSLLGVTHTGIASVSISGTTRTITANKTVGAGLNIVVRGLDSTGNALCQVADSTIGGTVSAVCPDTITVKYRAILVYNQ